jgi:SAM-dependent methyltransferase
MAAEQTEDKAITLGHPSYVWRFGQDRRLDLMRRHAMLDDQRILDVGCGLGMYVRQFRSFSAEVYGVDVDPEKVAQASRELPNIQTAPAEELPFPDDRFDVVLLHEVLEHVTDDRLALAEALRVTDPGGRVLVFVPNRWYPFETHGAYWRGQYHFGNIPLVNYLPNRWRNRLAPHVRIYTGGDLRRLVNGLPGRIVYHTQIYPGFDNVVSRRPRLGDWLRRVTYALEHTPLRAFGLSHFLVIEKV